MIDQFRFKNLICIQLDVEGHELFALKGAKKTIYEHNPIIMIEDNEQNCSDFLENSGYRHCANIPGLHIWSSEKRYEIVELFVKHCQNLPDNIRI